MQRVEGVQRMTCNMNDEERRRKEREERMCKEMETARKEAYSFHELYPPNNAKLIGMRIDESGEHMRYFKDDEGNYYWDTVEQLERKKQTKRDIAKRRKRCFYKTKE